MLKKKAKGKASSGFEYHPRSSEDVRKRAEQQGGQFDSIFRDGVDKWRPKDGENVIRILPPTWEEHDHYGYDIWVHGFVGPDKSTYLCPQKMQNEQCPICKAARDAKAAGEEDDAKQLTARRQVAVWIIDRDDDTPTPKLFTMSWSMDRDLATLCHDKKRGRVLLIDHPDEGYDISFSRTGKGLNTRYIGMAVDRESSPISTDEDEQERILEYIQENPIPGRLNFYDADYLEKVIEGGADERDEDLDESEEDEAAAVKKSHKTQARTKRRIKRRAENLRAEPEEEEAPFDEDIEEPDEDDEPPKKKGAHKPEEEEEEDVEEEEEEEPAPKKKARRPEPEEEEEEEEEEPATRRKSARRAEPEEEEEEDLEEEDVEEEEDEEPAPKKKPAAAKFRSKSRR